MVMMFHSGRGVGGGKETVEADARLAAAQGCRRLRSRSRRILDQHRLDAAPFLEDEGASCATPFALENAGEFGGDPDDLTLASILDDLRQVPPSFLARVRARLDERIAS